MSTQAWVSLVWTSGLIAASVFLGVYARDLYRTRRASAAWKALSERQRYARMAAIARGEALRIRALMAEHDLERYRRAYEASVKTPAARKALEN